MKLGSTLELRYAIADGYCIFRDRFQFLIDGQPVSIPQHSRLPGIWKQGATFRRVITYRNSVRLLLPAPLSKQALPQDDCNLYVLSVRSQGCADAGVCYPPFEQVVEVVLGASEWSRPTSAGNRGCFSFGAQQGSGFTDRSMLGTSCNRLLKQVLTLIASVHA